MSLEGCHETNVKLAEKLDSDNDDEGGGGGKGRGARNLAYQIAPCGLHGFVK